MGKTGDVEEPEMSAVGGEGHVEIFNHMLSLSHI